MASSREARAAVDLTFEELYRGHRAEVYRAALRELGNAHDAEDVTQAAFIDAYRAVLRGTRPESPRAWLLAISENVRRRGFRTAQRRPREELVEDADLPLTADLPHEQSRALAEALASLPPEQRRVFVLREMVGLSYVEIAEEVDSTVASVQMLLFRARRLLRDQLDPPTVSRRPIFLPGWLVGLWSRIEMATLTPRAAGALGAAVLTIAGASVAVPVPQALGRDAVTARVAAAARAEAAPAVAKPQTGPQTKPGVRLGAVGATKARPVQRSRPVATPAPAGAPASAPTPGSAAAVAAPLPDVVATAATPRAAPALEPTGVAATVVDDVLQVPAGVAATVVDDVLQVPAALPLPPGVLPPVALPPVPVALPRVVLPPVALPPVALPPVAVPPVPAVVEAATGAAGAAGASAPPLPVPAVPLPTLPPTP
jgi:RNA polymerase sigma-70 factor, ECF subfamily